MNVFGSLKRFFSPLAGFLVVFWISSFVFLPLANAASSINYCLDGIDKSGCLDASPHTFEDFLVYQKKNPAFYPASGFDISNGYLYFKTDHYSFKIKSSLAEKYLKDEPYGELFDIFDWFRVDDDRNLVPDDIDMIADLFEEYYKEYMVDGPFGTTWNGRVPVTLSTSSDFNIPGLYVPDGLKFDSSGNFEISLYLDKDYDDLRAAIARELFYTVEYLYVKEDVARLSDRNHLMMGMAVAMERVYASRLQLLTENFEYEKNLHPDNPIFALHNDATSYIWYYFLHLKYGDEIFREILIEYKNSQMDEKERMFTVLENVLKARGSSLTDEFLDYVVRNYSKETKYDRNQFYKILPVRTFQSVPKGKVLIGEAEAPRYFASNYLEFDIRKFNLPFEVEFHANEAVDMYVSVFYVHDGNLEHIRHIDDSSLRHVLVRRGQKATFDVPVDLDATKFIMVVSPIVFGYDEAIYSGETFSYSFYVEPIWTRDVMTLSIEGDSLFLDLDEDHQNYRAIEYLKEFGVLSGYPDGTFRPGNGVNRAELLTILVAGVGEKPSVADYHDCFPDVQDEWFAPAVCYAKEKGWVQGYPDGTFQPAKNVNKVESLKMLLNSQSVELPETVSSTRFDDVPVGEWFTPFVWKASQLGLLEELGAVYEPGMDMHRAGVAEVLYRLLRDV